tara:strand:+ start:1338 stop:2339 length:1002 start_codon:yes stop_codon:yes gene_type:complete
MSSEHFFTKKGPFPLEKIAKVLKLNDKNLSFKNIKINDIKTLLKAKPGDITFLNSSKYKNFSLKTKASACIARKNLFAFLPKNCFKIDVSNVLFSVTLVAKMFYPKADVDHPDLKLKDSFSLKKKYPKVIFGKNALIGKNVKIGENTFIGSNTIIESNVTIGKNCLIGSFAVIKNSFISDNVHIQDGCKIGIKGFGFIPNNLQNIRTPHVGAVIIKNNVEIGANSTIDRGSLDDTIIGENTFIDNQVHIAHNVKIGKNCMIAGQVGFAGSTILGNNVVIGGQAGVSGHLKIGNNVQIGGGSGVINNIEDNSKVMGYPAVPLKDFIKLRVKNEK